MPASKLHSGFLYFNNSHLMQDMKHLIFTMLVGIGCLLISQNTMAQSSEILTNSKIIKLAKASLSDDIILDMIHSSKVTFNISADSLKLLLDNHVSQQVIEAMKTAQNLQQPPAPKPVPVSEPPTIKAVDNKPVKDSITVKK